MPGFSGQGEPRIRACPGLDPGSGAGAGIQYFQSVLDSGFRRSDYLGGFLRDYLFGSGILIIFVEKCILSLKTTFFLIIGRKLYFL
jgi:hypothetical protein